MLGMEEYNFVIFLVEGKCQDHRYSFWLFSLLENIKLLILFILFSLS